MTSLVPSVRTILAVAALVGGTGLALPSDAEAARTRLQCRSALSGQDASMTARYEVDGNRRKFTVEVEARPGGSFRRGDVLEVEVKNRTVGSMTLRRAVNDLVGDLNFDTTAGPRDQADPFPSGFPAVAAGTVVEAGPFRCALQRR